jgi:hypothetical protein
MIYNLLLKISISHLRCKPTTSDKSTSTDKWWTSSASTISWAPSTKPSILESKHLTLPTNLPQWSTKHGKPWTQTPTTNQVESQACSVRLTTPSTKLPIGETSVEILWKISDSTGNSNNNSNNLDGLVKDSTMPKRDSDRSKKPSQLFKRSETKPGKSLTKTHMLNTVDRSTKDLTWPATSDSWTNNNNSSSEAFDNLWLFVQINALF